MNRIKLAGFTVVLLFGTTASGIQNTERGNQNQSSTTTSVRASTQPGSTTMLAATDVQFINDAAMQGLAEVELGRIALKQSTRPEVKQFAQKMIDEHSKKNEELRQLAQAKGVTIPADLDQKYKAKADQLSKLTGPKFDQKYMKEQVKDHQKAVKRFQTQSTRGMDPELKQWASTTLPHLQHHLEMARTTSQATMPARSNQQTGQSTQSSGSQQQ
jgi:putative membrane protein